MATRKASVTKRKTAARPSTPPRNARARIRMYRVGLGDCFLLTFFTGAKPRHILIDCGMFAGSRLHPAQKERELQREIVQHIAVETKKHIDVVVVTHEHMDHLSMFNSAKAEFEEIKFGAAWFGWVEADTKAAKELRKKYENLEASFGVALAALEGRAGAAPGQFADLHSQVAELAGFAGFSASGKKIKEQPRTAIDYVKERVAKASQRFGSPGDSWKFAGVTVKVLGPPPTEKQLRVLERVGATYDSAFAAQLGGGGAVELDWYPFDPRWRRALTQSGTQLSFSAPSLHGPFESILDAYQNREDAWRRIDDYALGSISTFALQMDNYVNNTSLALAFEFDDGDVLLFPGDAQVGNWQCWSTDTGFDMDKLLPNTIFYKVGHHGSHNATLKAALDQMTNSRLVAMIPTNENFARNSKKWKMPARNLNKVLKERTGGRILRNDQGMNRVPNTLDDPACQWGDLKKRVIVHRLYIDYYV